MKPARENKAERRHKNALQNQHFKERRIRDRDFSVNTELEQERIERWKRNAEIVRQQQREKKLQKAFKAREGSELMSKTKRYPLKNDVLNGPPVKVEPITATHTPERWIKKGDFYPPLAPGHYRITRMDGTEERIQVLDDYVDEDELKTRRILRSLGT